VILPTDAPYDTARQVWNRHPDHRPAVIVQAAGTADVVAAVRFAARHDLPVSVKSGGHQVAGLGAGEGAVMVDMTRMRAVVVDPVARTAVVQGGASARDVIRETQAFGLALPTGNIGRVGVAALALGGGMGFLRRRYGLTCDHLLGADMVLADGTFIHVDATHHPDLFWAIRGGGGNFGIAVALYVRLVPVGPTVAGIHTVYRLADAEAVLTGCRTFLAQCGEDVSVNIDMLAVPPAPGVPPFLAGQTVVMVSGLHAGAQLDEAVEAVQPVRTWAEPLMDQTGPMDYGALHAVLDHLLPEAHQGYMESLYVRELSDPLIQTVTAIMAEAHPGQMCLIWPLGGQMARVPDGATAFGDRGAGVLVAWEAGWEDPGAAAAGQQWVRRNRHALRAEAYRDGTYLNVMDTSGDNAAVVARSYGAQYSRLQALKRQYDPTNRFRFNANIVPA
jgi:FAD/FMN-containing dehydrogenase